jgi:peptide/nickel transport system substrate-binding protein
MLVRNCFWIALTAVLTIAACAPARQQTTSGGSDQTVQSSALAAQGPKTLIIAGGRDHATESDFGKGISDAEISDLLGAGLFRKNALTFSADPWLAEESPSVERGTWIVNPDGTMVTRYRLRPNTKWHDGTPLTTQDFVLGWEMIRDPKLAHGDASVANAISSIETPDDRTLVLHWSQTFNRADAIMRSRLAPQPRHIVEPLYRTLDAEQLIAHPVWTTQLVSSGPFKVTRWQQGEEMELQAFDDYFLGRPKIDRIIWRFIFDLNTMLSNVLANNVDAALRQAFTLDTGLVAKEQWEARGEGTISFTPVTMDWVNLSPLNPWLTDIRVRRAMLHAIDRQAMVETVSHGLETVAPFPLAPKRPQYERALASATKYDYDLNRARQLMAEAGWTPGPDGILVNGRGERFSIDARTGTQQSEEQLQTVVVDYWKRLGVESQINNLSSRQQDAEEFRGRWNGAKWSWQSMSVELWVRFYGTDNIPTAEKRWIGNNEARWDDPAKEAVLTELNQTLDPRRKDDLVVEFARLFADQLPHLPLKYQAEVQSVRKGIVNLYPRSELGGENTRTWNAEQWDLL